jgi:hypothetical protein
MRISPLLAAAGVLLAACNPIGVTTSVAPDANFSSLRTFKVLNLPARRSGLPSMTNDPMLETSVSGRELRNQLATAFNARGYAMDEGNPDFTIAYYASRRGKLDVTAWDYGYPGRWGGWRRGGGPMVDVNQYVEGTVIVDVVDPKTHELVWRGRGVSNISDDAETYGQNLERTVKAIVAKFPARQARAE